MASRYWVGGTAAWDGTAGTKWALTSGGAGGQAVPTSADDVFFDAASGAVTVTADGTWSGSVKSITCTGFTGTFSFANLTLSVATNFILSSGMTFTAGTRLTLTGTGTLTPAGKAFNAITINAPSSTVTLGGALTCNVDLVLSAGTFTTTASNYAITALQFVASGAGTKTLTLNGSTVTLSDTSTTAFNYSGSNLTLSAGTSTINLSGSSTTFAGGGLTFNNVAFTATTPGTRTVSGANTFAQLTFTAPASSSLAQYEFGANQTITTFVCAGASAVRRIGVSSTAPGTARTLTVGTYTTKTDVDFRDITAAGASAPWSGTRLGDCKGCTSITFAAAKTVYWNLAGTQNWSATGWATTSGGAPAVNNFPLAQDTAVFNNTGAAGTVTFDYSWNIGTLDMSARTNAMTLSGGYAVSVYGSWTCGTGVTQSLANLTYFRGLGTQTITSAGQSFYAAACYSPSGTVSLADAFTTTATSSGLSLLYGATFNANTYSVTTYSVSANSSAIGLGTGTWTISGSGNCWNCSSATITGNGEIVLSNNTTTARSFIGNTGSVYGKLTIGGGTSTSTTTITGVTMTFSEIASTKTVAHTIVFPNTTTTVGDFTVQGSAGNVVTLSRTGASGTFTLAKSGGGVVSSDYLSISNSAATPSNTWYAGANSTNGGGNTGWIFTAAPGGGNFIAFFM